MGYTCSPGKQVRRVPPAHRKTHKGLMAQATENLAVLFADISGSTALYDRLGDATASELVAMCMAALSRVAEQQGGTVIKTIGDEVMCTFPDPVRASCAAGDMHSAVRKLFSEGKHPVREMHISVGVHYGPVLVEPDDVYGDTVNVASRMVKLAKSDQTIASRELVEELPASMRMNARFYDQATLKGKVDHFDVYELIWEVAGMTMMADSQPTLDRITHNTLIIRQGEQEKRFGKEDAPIVLGRQEGVDVMVVNGLTSRKHAIIEYSRGRFVLVDQSVNGTFVLEDGGGHTSLRRDRLTLDGSGIISLGQRPNEAPDMVIHYETH